MFKIAGLRCRAQIPSIREKRILAPLPSDSGGRPVSGKYGDGVLEGKQFLPNAFQEQVSIPAGKIPAPDTSTEKNVSADNNLLIQKVKAQASWTMSRHVVNPHGRTEQFGGIAHVFSAYDSKRLATDSVPFARGINSIQLFNDGKRWWVVTVFWDSERPDNPLTTRYLGRP